MRTAKGDFHVYEYDSFLQHGVRCQLSQDYTCSAEEVDNKIVAIIFTSMHDSKHTHRYKLYNQNAESEPEVGNPIWWKELFTKKPNILIFVDKACSKGKQVAAHYLVNGLNGDKKSTLGEMFFDINKNDHLIDEKSEKECIPCDSEACIMCEESGCCSMVTSIEQQNLYYTLLEKFEILAEIKFAIVNSEISPDSVELNHSDNADSQYDQLLEECYAECDKSCDGDCYIKCQINIAIALDSDDSKYPGEYFDWEFTEEEETFLQDECEEEEECDKSFDADCNVSSDAECVNPQDSEDCEQLVEHSDLEPAEGEETFLQDECEEGEECATSPDSDDSKHPGDHDLDFNDEEGALSQKKCEEGEECATSPDSDDSKHPEEYSDLESTEGGGAVLKDESEDAKNDIESKS